MTPLEQLEQLLRRRFRYSSVGAVHTEEGTLARLNIVRQAFSPRRGRFSDGRVAKGVMAFRVAGEKTPYPDLKYACYGVARPMDWEGRILLVESYQLDQLLRAVQALSRWPHRFSACRRALQATADIVAAELREAPAGDYRQAGLARLERFLVETAALTLPMPPISL